MDAGVGREAAGCSAEIKPDVIVVDPPRKGVSADT